MDAHILFFSLDCKLRNQVKSLLLGKSFDVINVNNLSDILKYARNNNPVLFLFEIPVDLIQEIIVIAKQIKKMDRRSPVIMLTSEGSEELAIASLKLRINDFFKLPICGADFIKSVNFWIANRQSLPYYQQSKPSITAELNKRLLIGESLPMKNMTIYLNKVARVDCNALITGETGTGKELAAKSIHLESSRCDKPFVAINCAALPESLLESELFGYEKGAFSGAQCAYDGKLRLANGGTVFFDEIGDMPVNTQAKLLRVIENKEVFPLGGKRAISMDIRVIAATNCDLETMVSEREFRQDLYFRLNIARVKIPPLRERKQDIRMIADHFIQRLNRRYDKNISDFTEEAEQLLLTYDWPGNVRELKNLLESIYIDPPKDRIGIKHLSDSIYRFVASQNKQCISSSEQELLLSTLSSVNWNKSKAAEKLKISRMTLYRKLAKYQT